MAISELRYGQENFRNAEKCSMCRKINPKSAPEIQRSIQEIPRSIQEISPDVAKKYQVVAIKYEETQKKYNSINGPTIKPSLPPRRSPRIDQECLKILPRNC